MKTNFFNFRHSPKQSITLLALIILGLGFTTQAWAWGWSAGDIYLDNTVTSNFPGLSSTPYFRIGHSTYNEARAMTRVAGTAALYKAPFTGKFDNFDEFNIANDYGWTGKDNRIHQPFVGDDKKIYPTTNKMTHALNYTNNQNIGADMFFIPTYFSKTENECSYYDFDRRSEGWTITISTPHGGTLKVEKYNNDEGTSLTEVPNNGTVLPTQYIKVTVVEQPTEYCTITKIKVGNDVIGIGSRYAVRGDKTVQPVYTEFPYAVTLTGFTKSTINAYAYTQVDATLNIPSGKEFASYSKDGGVYNDTKDGNVISFNATAAGTLTATYTYKTPQVASSGNKTYTLGGAAIKLNPTYTDVADDATYTWTCTSAPAGGTVTFSATDVANPNVSANVVGEYTIHVVVSQDTPAKQGSADITLTVADFSGADCGTCFQYTAQ